MKKRSLLVVEENQESLELLIQELKQELAEEFVILRAANGRQALKILDIITVDCLIAAANMPEMTGLDLLKKTGSTGHNVKTILIDRKGDTLFKERCNKLGLSTYLSHSFLTKALIKEVKEVVNNDIFFRKTLYA